MWRNMDARLRRLRLSLEREDADAVPSYRIATAEGFAVLEGLGSVEEYLREALNEMRPKAGDGGEERGQSEAPDHSDQNTGDSV